jgi:hypothetical protein
VIFNWILYQLPPDPSEESATSKPPPRASSKSTTWWSTTKPPPPPPRPRLLKYMTASVMGPPPPRFPGFPPPPPLFLDAKAMITITILLVTGQRELTSFIGFVFVRLYLPLKHQRALVPYLNLCGIPALNSGIIMFLVISPPIPAVKRSSRP